MRNADLKISTYLSTEEYDILIKCFTLFKTNVALLGFYDEINICEKIENKVRPYEKTIDI